MRIDELSVGDWVIYDRDTTPVQIVGLYQRNKQDCVVMSDSYYPEGVIGFVEYLKPIRITTEILEKNGLEFIDDGNDAIIFLCCDMYWARLCVGDCFWSIGVHSKDRLDAVMCDVKYVHQLQHALRLARVGKEIVL
jgi:hypothetical protein